MQYLLTQAEHDALVPRADLERAHQALQEVRPLLLAARGYSCWHEPDPRPMPRYCDACPVMELPEVAGRLVCPLTRNLSK